MNPPICRREFTLEVAAGAATIALPSAALAAEAGSSFSAARFRPALSGDDRYEVLTAYSADSNRATNATFVVHHADGATPVVVNQQVAGTPDIRTRQWVSLGVFSFRGGLDGYVELSDAADGVIIADAVRFRRQAAQ